MISATQWKVHHALCGHQFTSCILLPVIIILRRLLQLKLLLWSIWNDWVIHLAAHHEAPSWNAVFAGPGAALVRENTALAGLGPLLRCDLLLFLLVLMNLGLVERRHHFVLFLFLLLYYLLFRVVLLLSWWCTPFGSLKEFTLLASQLEYRGVRVVVFLVLLLRCIVLMLDIGLAGAQKVQVGTPTLVVFLEHHWWRISADHDVIVYIEKQAKID